jgi:phage terminase small subunit
MPARKPAGLINRAETKAKRAARVDGEQSLTPEKSLPMRPPARLLGHETAVATWRRTLRTYGEIEAQVVTRLDSDLLVDYCILMEQVHELDEIRQTAYKVWKTIKASWARIATTGDADEIGKKAQELAAALSEIVKLDGRGDRKRALLLQLRQSLYLTPRARAGAAPKKKEEEQPLDDMDMLLSGINDELNKK